MQEIGETGSDKNKAAETGFHILVVSPQKNRVAQVLKLVLSRSSKNFELTSFELYRQAVSSVSSPLGKRTVALVITDLPDDANAPSRSGEPLWKETISVFNEQYQEVFGKEIQAGYLPKQFTVITLFQKIKGKLSEHQLKEIEENHKKFLEEQQIKHPFVWSDEELSAAIDRAVIAEVEKMQDSKIKPEKPKDSRAARLAKAKTVTKAAHRRQ